MVMVRLNCLLKDHLKTRSSLRFVAPRKSLITPPWVQCCFVLPRRGIKQISRAARKVYWWREERRERGAKIYAPTSCISGVTLG